MITISQYFFNDNSNNVFFCRQFDFLYSNFSSSVYYFQLNISIQKKDIEQYEWKTKQTYQIPIQCVIHEIYIDKQRHSTIHMCIKLHHLVSMGAFNALDWLATANMYIHII